MWMLISLLSACSEEHQGTMEDAYGHPRALLANCAQTYDNGYEALYDNQGYTARIGHPDEQAFIEYETTLDDLERPVRIQSWFSYDGERGDERPVWEADYLEDSWRIAQLRTATETVDRTALTLDYSWSRNAYQVSEVRELVQEGDRQCPQYVQLDVGLRPALSQTFCDGALEEETAYTWAQDRLVAEGSPQEDGPKIHYSYNAEGRLAEIDVDNWDGQSWGVADHSFTWDCD